MQCERNGRWGGAARERHGEAGVAGWHGRRGQEAAGIRGGVRVVRRVAGMPRARSGVAEWPGGGQARPGNREGAALISAIRGGINGWVRMTEWTG